MTKLQLRDINFELKEKGYRYSALREAIFTTIINLGKPIAVKELLQELDNKYNLSPNKTSVYRELETLIQEKFINEVDLMDGKKRYETLNNKHNHEHSHLICTDCGDIECIEIEE
ncbi:MAG TPA: transcriptional repressor, partial [Vampirovibrionales bacterium]